MHAEKERIISSGGTIVVDESIMKVQPGGLLVTRSIGDLDVKAIVNGVIAIPDIMTLRILSDNDFILLGSKMSLI